MKNVVGNIQGHDVIPQGEGKFGKIFRILGLIRLVI